MFISALNEYSLVANYWRMFIPVCHIIIIITYIFRSLIWAVLPFTQNNIAISCLYKMMMMIIISSGIFLESMEHLACIQEAGGWNFHGEAICLSLHLDLYAQFMEVRNILTP